MVPTLAYPNATVTLYDVTYFCKLELAQGALVDPWGSWANAGRAGDLPIYPGLGSPEENVTQPQQHGTALTSVESPIRDFAARHRLEGYLQMSEATARRYFDLVEPPTVGLKVDPDAGETWLELRVVVQGCVEDVLRAQDDYTQAWIQAAPIDLIPLIRLCISIA